MKHEITTTRMTTTKVVFDLSEEPVFEGWAGYTHKGKRVKLGRMGFIVEQVDDGKPTVGRLHITGTVVKKDGTLSGLRAETDIWGSWVNETDGGRFYKREAEAYGHLIERARAVAKEVLAR